MCRRWEGGLNGYGILRAKSPVPMARVISSRCAKNGIEATADTRLKTRFMTEQTVQFTDDEIARLSDQIDAELLQLQKPGEDGRHLSASPSEQLPRRQREAIEAATGGDAATFWAEFRREACSDLFHKDGFIYKQWQKYNDIDNKDLVKGVGAVLAALGLSQSVILSILAVISAYLLYIGLKVFCARD
jgi:hypothetical protein